MIEHASPASGHGSDQHGPKGCLVLRPSINAM
jgi:hypothetical protein